MVHALVIGLLSLGLGVLFSIPGVALGFWLQRTHRGPNRYRASILTCIMLVLIQQIWFTGLRYDLLALLMVLASTLGVYRMDIYWAMQRDSGKG